MADNKYMSSRLVPKVGGQDIRKKGSELYSKSLIDEGLPKGNNNYVSSPVITHTDGKIKPLHDSTTDGSFVTKTETIVEYTRVPVATMQGSISSSIIAPVGTTLSSSHHQSPTVEDSNSKFQTESTRPYTAYPMSNFYWWCKPPSQHTGGTHDNGRPYDTGINKYYQPSDGSMHQHLHEHTHRRNEKMSDAKQEPAATSPPKGSSPTKPSNFMETTADQSKGATIVIVPPRGHLLPLEVSKTEVLQPSIDSREAARRYGGLSSAPVVAYVPAIDSREAAWKYRGEML